MKQFLNKLVNEKIENLNAPEYISFFNKFIEKELYFIEYYLPIDKHKLFQKLIFEEIIGEQAEVLKNKPSGFENMFSNSKLEELSEAYRLFLNYEPSLYIFLEEMNKYIKARGKEIYTDELLKKEPIEFINKTMELQRNIGLMIQDCFNNDRRYIDANNEAFNDFMKEAQIYPKFLAIYCDSYMRISVKTKNEIQLEEDLNNIISLLKCLNDKHVFKMKYNKLLSDRILDNKTGSLDAEKLLINKISNELGNNFVYEFSIIIQDIESSSKFNENFKTENHNGIISGINLNCRFLQQTIWDINPNKDFKLDIYNYSPKINRCMEALREFYLKSNTSRKFQYVLGLVSEFL